MSKELWFMEDLLRVDSQVIQALSANLADMAIKRPPINHIFFQQSCVLLSYGHKIPKNCRCILSFMSKSVFRKCGANNRGKKQVSISCPPDNLTY